MDERTNGCPSDRDGDGIADAEDACLDDPGPKDPFFPESYAAQLQSLSPHFGPWAAYSWAFELLVYGLHATLGWLGILLYRSVMWVVVAAVYARRAARRGVRSWVARGALVTAILLVVATAHAGGLLAHGRGFFDW